MATMATVATRARLMVSCRMCRWKAAVCESEPRVGSSHAVALNRSKSRDVSLAGNNVTVSVTRKATNTNCVFFYKCFVFRFVYFVCNFGQNIGILCVTFKYYNQIITPTPTTWLTPDGPIGSVVSR